MLFRQLFDARSSTYTYLVADAATGDAALIDPVFEQVGRDTALVRELGLTLRYTIETHVHADHVTGAWRLRALLGSQIAVSRHGNTVGADRLLADGDRLEVGALALDVLETPGHTDGCVSIVTGDRAVVFTGDALLIRGAGRTDFQQGDAHRLYHSVHDRLFALPDACLVYPGHDYQGRTASSIGEERRHNPRLGGTCSEDDFAGYMANLGLPHPKQLEVAVPANLRCGQPDDATVIAPAPTWGAVRSFAGVPEVDVDWVQEHLGAIAILDVREAAELVGELGMIAGAQHVPLAGLRARVDEVPRDRPVIAVCRAGGRSAQAALILESAGVAQVANLRGGMIEWRARQPAE